MRLAARLDDDLPGHTPWTSEVGSRTTSSARLIADSYDLGVAGLTRG